MARKTKLPTHGLLNKAMLLALTPVLLTGLSACSGSDGAAGLNGTNGTNGTNAPVGDESCMVCHATAKIEDIAVVHPDPTNKNLAVTINSVTNAGGFPVVNFHVASGSTGITGLGTTIKKDSTVALSIKIADLIPAKTGDNIYSTAYYEMWTSETPAQDAHPACAAGTKLDTKSTSATYNTCLGGSANASSLGSLATPATPALVPGATDGDYSYTFTTAFGSSWPGYNKAGYAAANKKRVAIEFNKPASGYNRSVGIVDIAAAPAAGATATTIDSQRQFVTIEACRKCHGPLMDGAAHANSRNDMRECVFCHSPLYASQPSHDVGFMATDNADLPIFIHQIHNSNYTGPVAVEGDADSPVTFPQNIKNCVVCHIDPSGKAPGDLSGLNNWKTNPSGRVCASCHTKNTLNADGSMNHDPARTHSEPSSAKTDAQCGGCHGSAGTAGDMTDIVTAHDTTYAGADAPEFDVTLSTTAPANGQYYAAGETFTVNATLKNHATGADVDPAVYTTAQDAAYVSGGGLYSASLYVYGPRNYQKPLLAAQSNSLFGKGDATGFHYAVTVPANTAAGTYMVRTRFGDYSYNRSSPAPASQAAYKTESFKMIPIQIGTATVEKKIDGDACVNCHGATLMHLNDHAAPFDTDQCAACHDRSGGHADYIGNRVHAIHAANSKGDLTNFTNGVYTVSATTGLPSRDWKDVTFPIGAIDPNLSGTKSTQVCVVCHTNSSGTYKTNSYASPCVGCHGDDDAKTGHMVQNGAKF